MIISSQRRNLTSTITTKEWGNRIHQEQEFVEVIKLFKLSNVHTSYIEGITVHVLKQIMDYILNE